MIVISLDRLYLATSLFVLQLVVTLVGANLPTLYQVLQHVSYNKR